MLVQLATGLPQAAKFYGVSVGRVFSVAQAYPGMFLVLVKTSELEERR